MRLEKQLDVDRMNKLTVLKFIQKYINYSPEYWRRLLWRDESKFNIIESDGKQYVHCPLIKSLDPKYTPKTLKHYKENVMHWDS